MMSFFKRWKKLFWQIKGLERRLELIERNQERLLNERYKNLLPDKNNYKAKLQDQEFSIFSQNGEDGLILFIFSLIGTTNKTFIEFGCGNGRQCNTANLTLNFDWNGLLLDGSKNNIQLARSFYKASEKVNPDQLKVEQAFLTTANINQTFKQHGFEGEIDLLSIDIDGNDYWIWKKIQIVNPRVVVVEYNASFGIDRSVTVKYDPSFERFKKHKSGWYHGASLKALEKLGKEKGYSLVGCNFDGVNAFFVRSDIALSELQQLSTEEAYYPERKRLQSCSTEMQYNLIKGSQFVNV